MPSVVTANVLRTGTVAYLNDSGAWVESLADATPATNEEARARLEKLALAAVARSEVTAVYAFDVAIVDGHPTPISVREQIRAAGAPTV